LTSQAEGANGTRTLILDAAERIFGEHGFDGASMREIAQAAGVAQALLHYHFRNKETLYEAVFERRASTIRAVRERRLEKLFGREDPVALEDVLAVLFMSLEELLGARRGDLRYYVQMLADVTTSTDPRSTQIMKRLYDPTAERFIEALRRVLPELSQERAVWAYLFAIGARMQAHAPTDRASRLGAARRATAPYRLLIPFVAAGIRAIVPASQAAPLDAETSGNRRRSPRGAPDRGHDVVVASAAAKVA